MQYPYDSVPGAGHDAQTSAASGYDISDYSYQTAPRDAGMATTMDEYSFSSYPATAPPVDEGPTTPVYSFAGPVNGSSTYMTSAGRLPPPHPPYSPYSQPNLMPGHAQHSPSLAQPSMPLRPNNYRSGRSADDIHDRVPQMPPMTVGHHGLSATDSAPEHIRTPRTQQPPLGSLATSVNDYHNGSPRSGSDIDSTAKLVEAAIPEEFRNAVLAQVYVEEEKNKYARYASRLKELIGTKYHDFKAADVEYFLWRVGFEEHVPEQSPKSRKRKIKKARDLLEKLNEGPHIQSATAPWNSAFANPHMPGHQQYPLPDPNQSMATAQYNYKYNVLADFPTPAFSDEQKDEVVASLAQKYGPIDTDDTMDSNYSDSPGDQTMKNGTPDTSVYQRPMSSPSCNYSTTRNESSRK
ncbi:hypothetical protein SBRCBS47491_002598 [Sporothrix bragantina]|uniref:Clr5 domain-containing protein n=1 Tax=Sporothrix bragantina TaxID=671064 RepID=A0ABP0B8D1_9PEZI